MRDQAVHDALVRGLDYLERYGWVPYFACEFGEPACALGGLALGGGLGPYADNAADALIAASGCSSSDTFGDWNDRQPSFAPVKAAYCRAIEATDPSTSEPTTSESHPQAAPAPGDCTPAHAAA
jgi:hypothetical protein